MLSSSYPDISIKACRELLFPLPALAARQAILDIHTRQWAEPPAPELKVELANMCVGYCGADMKVQPQLAIPLHILIHSVSFAWPQLDRLRLSPLNTW